MTTGGRYAPAMLDHYTIFGESELARIGIVCPACGTETVFDLSKDQTANQDRDCPGCGSSDFLKSFTTEARQNYNWITYYKKGRDMAKSVEVRLYFNK